MDVYIINLAERRDRWNTIIENIRQNSKILNPIRFNAIRPIQPIYCTRSGRKKNCTGEVGVALSHIAIVEMAKKNNQPFVMVFEDDTQIIEPNFDAHLTSLLAYLKSDTTWEIFNGNPVGPNPHTINIKNTIIRHSSPTIIECNGATANFIIYSSRVYNRIIALKDHYNTPSFSAIDTYISLQFKGITHWPILTTQRPGKSNIENRATNYTGLINNTINALTKVVHAKHKT